MTIRRHGNRCPPPASARFERNLQHDRTRTRQMVAHESDFRNDRQAAPRPVAVSNETSRHVCLRWESWGRYAPAVPADEAHEHRLTLIGIAALVKAWDGLQRVLDPASDLEPSGRAAPAARAAPGVGPSATMRPPPPRAAPARPACPGAPCAGPAPGWGFRTPPR